ncbi:MAG: diacylglycerol kinase family protein [Defluviitaleaceae bacterium]|nr:diacylglycerol kinase family protein [Defluviitaleaceae bacterium]
MNGKIRKCRNRIESFKYAFAGIRATVMREKSFRFQIFCAIAAVIACIIFQVDGWHFALVGFAIFFVLSMELMNTAIEAVVDLVAGQKSHPLAKMAKDAAAGAVLLASIFALIVAGIVALDVVRRFI